jgi:hypothetical protein
VTGGVAQLGERLLCKQEVIGSIPFTSTSDPVRVQTRAPRATFASGFDSVVARLFRSLTIRKKQCASAFVRGLMPGCDCIRALSNSENGNAVA